LDIPEDLHNRTMSELQGGQKVRVLLAQARFGNPDVLFLDEPTNNLDLDSVHWLQNHLRSYDGCLIVISHDRHFLNEICTHIADIDYQTVITYTGGYDDMVLAKTQVRARIEAGNAQREKKIAQLQEFIARFAAGTRSSQVQSRKKEVEAAADVRDREIQYSTALHSIRRCPPGPREDIPSKSIASRSHMTEQPAGSACFTISQRP
jgi:ATPase subunit of ABC transporter with duplicated ATPase domains